MRPNPRVSLCETIRALNDVKRWGLTKHIGISNFTVGLMRAALAVSREPLLVNQVEYHPYLSQRAVLEVLRADGMALIAYSPLALGRVFRDPTLQDVAERYGKNAGQVALRWLLQQDGVIAIPRSSREANIKANLEVFDFQLTAAEMAKISALATPHGRLADPFGLAPAWDDLSATERARRESRRIAQAVRARAGRVLRAALRS